MDRLIDCLKLLYLFNFLILMHYWDFGVVRSCPGLTEWINLSIILNYVFAYWDGRYDMIY